MDMNHHQMTVRILLLLVCLLLLGGLIYYFLSTSALQIPFLSSSPKVAPVAQSPTASTSLAVPATGSGTSVLPTLPPKPPVTPPATSTSVSQGLVTITNADENGTVALANGQEFAINLGGNLNWTVQFSPAMTVEQIAASSTGAAQGTFKAIAPGMISLKASGAPICGPHQACPQFMAVFSTTLDVQ